MNKIIGILFALLTVFCKLVPGQTTDQDRIESLRNVIPPSPNASALAKYVDWPVNLYTGVPSIDIPIYTVKENDISVPVSISYHAGGHRVGEVASWIGLGWSLNAGGLISRSIRGLPDEATTIGSFAQSAIYNNPDNLCSVPNNANAAKLHKVESAKGLYDSEQDLYSFNALGKSFKFYIQMNGSIIPTKYSKTRIQSNITTPGVVGTQIYWIVTFEDGTKLEFGGAAGFVETTDFTKFDIGYFSVPTSWMLKKVTSANGTVIDFTYTGTSIKQDNNITESDYLKYRLLLEDPGGFCALYYGTQSNQKVKADRQDTYTLQLSTIESELTRVDFEHSSADRLDLISAKSLSKVKIYSKSAGQYMEIFRFNQSYSDAVSSLSYNGQALSNEIPTFTKRLKLNSLVKEDATTNTEQTWSFVYNPQSLPSRRSFAQDHWGYYNGKTQSNTLLPKYWYVLPPNILASYPNAGFNAPIFNKGASREGDAAYVQAEILKTIVYPTGGETEFAYEANTIPVNEEQFIESTKAVGLNLNAQSNPYTVIDEKTFVTTVPQSVKMVFDSYISQGIFDDMPGANVMATIIKQGGPAIGGASSTGVNTNILSHISLNDAGTYIIRISTNAGQGSFGANDAIIASAVVTYEESQGLQTINKCTGGLRLQKMVQKDKVDPAKNMEKSFVYEQPLIINPVDIQKMYFTETEEYTCNGTEFGTPYCHNKVITRNSSTKYSFGSIQGGTVGYGKVTTLYGVNGANGKSISEFTNEQDAGMGLVEAFPFAPSDSREWRRGLLIKQSEYNAANTLLKQTENSYQYLFKGSYGSFKAGYILKHHSNGMCSLGTCGDAYGDCGIQKVCYNTSAEQVNILSSTEKVFDHNGLNPVITTINYFYDNPNNLVATRTEMTNSKGEVIKTITRTPLEKAEINAVTPLSPTESAAVDEMIIRNIISPVLQTEVQKNNNLLSRSLVTYKNWGGLVLQPEKVKIQTGNNPIETRLNINSYDSYGNLLEQQKQNNVVECYIWGYGNNYPVAKVLNKTYTDAINQSSLNMGIINNPASTDAVMRAELNKLRTIGNCLATTYTYKPLVGITSETDINGRTTYYEYDNFNRLSLIRDKDNNVIKKICYNYAGQPENCLTPAVYYNTQMSQSFTRNNCPPCQTGSQVTYTVAAGMYSSAVSQSAADQPAQNDINTNGQNYANANGTCSSGSNVTITSQNVTNVSGFTAVYTNLSTNQVYSFNIPASGSTTLGCIPAGTYSLSVSKPGNILTTGFDIGCMLVTGTSAYFASVNVSSTTCNYIHIGFID